MERSEIFRKMLFKHLGKITTLLPLEEIEDNTAEQIAAVVEMDEVLKLAIMPDVHLGYGMPIGGVALIDNHISPGFVGYDIGCGMCHVDTGVSVEELFPDDRQRKYVYNTIQKAVPMDKGGEFNFHVDYEIFNTASGNQEMQDRMTRPMQRWQDMHSHGNRGNERELECGYAKSSLIEESIRGMLYPQ